MKILLKSFPQMATPLFSEQSHSFFETPDFKRVIILKWSYAWRRSFTTHCFKLKSSNQINLCRIWKHAYQAKISPRSWKHTTLSFKISLQAIILSFQENIFSQIFMTECLTSSQFYKTIFSMFILQNNTDTLSFV